MTKHVALLATSGPAARAERVAMGESASAVAAGPAMRCLYLGQITEALREFRWAVQRNPNNPALYWGQSRALAAAGRDVEARRAAELSAAGSAAVSDRDRRLFRSWQEYLHSPSGKRGQVGRWSNNRDRIRRTGRMLSARPAANLQRLIARARACGQLFATILPFARRLFRC